MPADQPALTAFTWRMRTTPQILDWGFGRDPFIIWPYWGLKQAIRHVLISLQHPRVPPDKESKQKEYYVTCVAAVGQSKSSFSISLRRTACSAALPGNNDGKRVLSKMPDLSNLSQHSACRSHYTETTRWHCWLQTLCIVLLDEAISAFFGMILYICIY